jgi:hypothetical protein
MLISLVPVTLLFLAILLYPDLFVQHWILQNLIIYRAHRKQLVMLVLSPLTMQWRPFKIYRWSAQTPAPLQLEDLGLSVLGGYMPC